MALTVTETTSTVFGAKRIVFASVDFDNSYPTGGESIAASDFDTLTDIEEIVVASSSPNAGKWVAYDRIASKLVVFTAAGTEAADASDQSGFTENLLMVIGY